MVVNFLRCRENYDEFLGLWRAKYHRIDPPCKQTLSRLLKKFCKLGTVADAPRAGRPRSARSRSNINAVARKYRKNPRLSLNRSNYSFPSLSRTSLWRILRKDLNKKPFRPKKVQGLKPTDPDIRMFFCNIMQQKIRKRNWFLRSIVWSDEAIFKLNGMVNTHNVVYWSDSNPHI